MKRFYLDYNEKQIIHAAVRLNRKTANASDFAKRAADAIEKAKDDLDVGEMDAGVRDVIIDKIYQSIAYGQAWELLGETYCSRGMFYQYRKQFCYLVADNMGLIDSRRKKQQGRR